LITIPVLHDIPVPPTFLNATEDGHITIAVPENIIPHKAIANFDVIDINNGKCIFSLIKCCPMYNRVSY